MSWAGRLRLFFGALGVILLVAACTVLFSQRQSRAVSDSATIVAQEFPVGTDYGGLVVTQLVQEGDAVKQGDPLFEVRSQQLQRDLAWEVVNDPTAAADGTATIVAGVDGTVSEIMIPQGGYAQAGGVLATIDRAETGEVVAEFTLTARDYGRLGEGSTVSLELPDRRTLDGTVEAIDVETIAGEAKATLTVASPEVARGDDSGLLVPGTPMRATVQLRDDGFLAGAQDAIADLLTQVGF
ncbi:HlyD family efflux transporter periplasmic adaptor subunit [Agromyces seonyuensis]|uniref:HlyD family efflux transporter periplasmic adaptor subunit n=1 Tax=Agromyces seonyuensis TaxID=2662446 RepID=A0A6I4NSF6_9MICO|nr:HlyD family efflux transporter periplasmic adaptor subunit [Agromyces seonyuensis]MWB97183.1 HlyD family efflux transporter periplasmic adaptor subunit [Agromyces seonyuensis]